MRELKFRALRKHKDGTTDLDYSKNWVSLSEFFNNLEVNYPDSIVMQHTGLSDAYNIELYFDDVIKVWYGARSKFDTQRVIRNIVDLANLMFEINEHGASFEVTGNIHNKN